MDYKEEDKTADETVALSHLKFLISFIEDEYAEQVSEIGSYINNGEISFDLLWAIMHVCRSSPIAQSLVNLAWGG